MPGHIHTYVTRSQAPVVAAEKVKVGDEIYVVEDGTSSVAQVQTSLRMYVWSKLLIRTTYMRICIWSK